MADIIDSISKASIIIADTTFFNPNVMYEVGLSHGARKYTIIIHNWELTISQSKRYKDKKYPFDLYSIRRIDYDINYKSIESLKSKLSNYLEAGINSTKENISVETVS
jgi:hypothetical protein